MDLAQDIHLPQKDWDAFRSGYSPFRFAEVVDRAELGLPVWFMPNARGAVVPSAQVMKPIAGRRVRPGQWAKILPGVFRQHRGELGRMTLRFGPLWALVWWGMHPLALTFRCGSTPVMFRSYREAMWLLRYYRDEQFNSDRNVIALHRYSWTPILPSFPDPAVVAELAAYRRSLEAADRAFWIKYDKSHGRGPALAA